eukprot:gene2928-biopygen14861
MFSITVPNVDLPVDLGFTQDFDLKLAIGDDGDVVVCGRHWTLFTTVTQPMADFEAAYGILQQTAMVSCAAAAAAEPPPLDIDDSCMPFDKLTYAVVVALEELLDNSCCPNTRVFAWLYAKHMRAADMDFMDLLQTPAIADMASTALDAWFVQHPMFRAQAHEAQDLLITVLDDYTPSRPWYEPYWLKSKFPAEKKNKTNEKIWWFVDEVRGRSAFLQSVASLVLDETFADNLDNNPDLFAVNNGVFDSSSRDTVVFRNVEMTDNISRCAKWDYHREDNYHLKRCKEDLDDFLRKVMPVDEERDVVLAFFAGLLSGRRKEKKFLAFTDKTSGENGKSTLMALLGSFFDEYGSSNGTKFMTKGSFARSRDDHDEGLKPMKGAGIVLVFNEGDCPKFVGGDSAFVKRMVVVPMRSNFVLHPDPQPEHEFERRDDLADALPTWRSALAQLLIEHFRRPGRSSIFDNLPVSMTEWKSCIADCATPLTEWLEEVVEMTGASSDAVWIGDLNVRWKESHYGHDTASVFSTKLVKAFFVGKQGAEWKETGRIDTKFKYGVGTVNVNYSSDIDVNLNFNGEIMHNDSDRIVLIFKSIKDYHYQRFKRNFTDMFDINIYGSHFGMLNNPKSAKSKEEIYLISNDPQQRLFAMGKLAIMCKWSDREDMLKARDFIKKQPTSNSNNNEKLYTSYLKTYFAIDRNNTTTTTSQTGAVSGIVKVGRIFSMTKLLENDVYWSVGAFLHIVSGRKDLTESMYVDSMLDNTGFIVSNLHKKHVCKKEVSPYTTVLRVAKYMERVLDAYMLCRHVKSEALLQKLLTMCSKLNIERKRNNGSGMFSTTVIPRTVEKELAKIPPGDLINRMNININTNQIKKTSTLDEQDAITELVQIIESATKQKEDFDKATRDFYIVYNKLKIAIMEACGTGPKLCGTVNSAMKPQKK